LPVSLAFRQRPRQSAANEEIMAAGEAGADGQLDEAYRRLMADDTIQFDLPAYVAPKPPAWAKPVSDLLNGLGPYMIYLFWGAVIIGALIIAVIVFLEAKGIAWRWPWQKARGETPAEAEFRPDAAVAQILIAEADALAARGKYDEAVHLLLQRSVADIATRLPDFLRPSLTARDIAGHRSLPAGARSAFAEMARIVEAALFARRPVGAGGWNEARSAYERFAFSGAWR
jgi:uncharacterized protein DUF4129